MDNIKNKRKDYNKRVKLMRNKLKDVLDTYINCYDIDNKDYEDWNLEDHYNRITQITEHFHYEIQDAALWD